MSKRLLQIPLEQITIDKLEAIRSQLSVTSRKDTIVYLVETVYSELFGGSISDQRLTIICDYKEQIGDLRVATMKLFKEINACDKEDELEIKMKKMNTINKQIEMLKSLSRLDGDINNILFSASESAKVQMSEDKNISTNTRNGISTQYLKHKINMDVNTRVAKITHGEEE